MSCLYKRSLFGVFCIEDDEILDVASLLKGEFEVRSEARLFACSSLTSSRTAVTLNDLELLRFIPADRWVSGSEVGELGMSAHSLEELVRHGLVLTNREDDEQAELRKREEVLRDGQWHPYAAFYHFMTRALDGTNDGEVVDYEALEKNAPERARQYVETFGPPPAPFQNIPGASRHDLPLVEKQGKLYDLLRRRRTTRGFDQQSAVSYEDFSTLLYYTFGFHGVFELSPEVPVLHRTSPSGGSRQPVEAYPMVLQVENLAAGIYHYDTENHALELVREYDLEALRALAVELTLGQAYVGSAHVVFIMTARFFRNYWKYRQRSKAYSVVLLDAAHLSQTFYLIATDLGLGAFFSAAVDGPKIEETLGIDGCEEGGIAVCGCGVKAGSGVSRCELDFRPFKPRNTKI